MRSMRKGLIAAVALIAGTLSAPAMAATVTFFQVIAIRPQGIVYDSTTGLSAGPGAVSNGSIFSPGLIGVITGGLPGVLDSPPGLGVAPPYFILSDLTLVLTGFAPVGDATVGTGSITQELTSGSFQIVHSAFAKPLLAGTVTDALVTEKKALPGPGPGDNASVLSGTVTYNDSVLEDSFAAADLDNRGTFSFGLTGITGNYGTTLVNGEHRLSNFSGDLTASFDAEPLAVPSEDPIVVPSPAAAWGGLGLVGLLGLARLKKRHDTSI